MVGRSLISWAKLCVSVSLMDSGHSSLIGGRPSSSTIVISAALCSMISEDIRSVRLAG